MIDFASAPAALTRLAPLDPTKHVKYTLGMVLGVDDFDQQHAYHSSRDRWIARDLTGYGTVWGLRLTVEVEAAGPRVNVAPGAAVTPCGQLVCVTPAQCASLNDWLAAHEEEARTLLLASSPPSSPPAQTLTLHAVLCYRECPTDDVPIPGEPCRTEQTLTAPSRVKDDFRLELRTVAPQQPEEDSIRDFAAWLRLVPVVEGPGSTIDALLAAIRAASDAALAELESPPGSPPHSPPHIPLDLLLGTPDPGLAIPAHDVGEYLRAAFRIWVTELRPALRHLLPGCDDGCIGTCGCGCDGSGGAPGEPCGDDVVLLGTIQLPVVATADGALVAADSGWVIDESRRPYVLHTRFLQEWLLESAVIERGSPPTAPPAGAPISDVTVEEGPLDVSWDPVTRVLDLAIPPGTPGTPGTPGVPGKDGAGVTTVAVNALASGSAPTASLANGKLTLGIPAGATGPPGGQGDPGDPGTQFVVVAGRFSPDDAGNWSTEWQALRLIDVRPVNLGAPGYFFVRFDDFKVDRRYMVKGTPIIRFSDRHRELRATHTFELVATDDELRRELEEFGEDPSVLETGLVIRTVSNPRDGSPPDGFELEISDYTDVEIR